MADLKSQLTNFAKQHNVPEFMQKDSDYVMLAEKVMNEIFHDNKKGKPGFGKLTTSKIRNVLTLVNDIYNDVIISPDNEMPQEIVDRIKYLKVRLVYEAGREEDVKKFVEKASLLRGLDCIGNDKSKFIRYARYLEALVAYRKFLGKDE